MTARDWRPSEAASLLREAREAATPTANLELVAAAVQSVAAEIEILRSLAEGDPNHEEHLQRAVERMSWAAEHLARHAVMTGDGDEIPF